MIPIFLIIFLTFLTIMLPIHRSCIRFFSVKNIINHKHSSQYNLDLEKFYITQNHDIMLHNNVVFRMTVYNC